MAEIVKGQLKDKLGNILHPETSFEQVKAGDGKALSTWRTEVEQVLPSSVQKSYLDNAGAANGVVILNADGVIDLDKLPAVLNQFKGNFPDAEALPAEGDAGNYAICTDTDTVWVWDEEKEGGAGWIDTGKKGAVSSVNGQTGDVTISLENLGLTVDAATLNGLPAAVEAAQGAADAAQTTADQGVADAAAAKTAADAAQGTADQGVADAATAQAAAEAAQAAAEAAATTAGEVDFAVVDNGAAAPATLREGGMYFEKAAAVTG